MISYLRGRLMDLDKGQVTVLAGQVGYEVSIGQQAMPEVGSEVELFVHWHQKTESPVLFGFLESQNRTLFRTLLSIHGVGPRIALGLVSGLGIQALKTAIKEGDANTLASVPGLSKKRAVKILGELTEKLVDGDKDAATSNGSPSPISGAPKLGTPAAGSKAQLEGDDVGEALRGLGYSQAEIDGVQGHLPDASTELRLRAAIEHLGRG